jgi:hypothetical protein
MKNKCCKWAMSLWKKYRMHSKYLKTDNLIKSVTTWGKL